MKRLDVNTMEELKVMISRASANAEHYADLVNNGRNNDDADILADSIYGVIEQAEDLIRLSQELLSRINK